MGLHNLDGIMTKLLAGGCEPQRPVALIQSGTSNEQRVLGGTVATIVALAANANFRSPALIVVGETIRLRKQLRWFDTGIGEMRSLGQRIENNGEVLI
jgi:siroheme synthase